MPDLLHQFDHLVLKPIKVGVAVFECPVCKNRVRHGGEGMGPACTGPSQSRDDHEMTPMERVG